MIDSTTDFAEASAQKRFGDYTQSIAFNMTLSRSMVEMLGILRDFGSEYHKEERSASIGNYLLKRGTPLHFFNRSVGLINALERRGLVIHDCPEVGPKCKYMFHPIPGHQYHRLSKAGVLMCELLTVAGLLAPALKRRKAA